MYNQLKVVHGVHVVTATRVLESGFVVVDRGRILEVSNEQKRLEELQRIYPSEAFIDGCGQYLIPGLIDIHVHGGYGKGFMDGDEEGLEALALSCLKNGTTGFLATTRAAGEQALLHIFTLYKEFLRTGSFAYKEAFLGVHMETPFINPIRRGGQDERWIRPIDRREIDRYLGMLGSELKIFSYAPELPGGDELTQELVQQGVIASIGHSNADFSEAKSAFDLGVLHLNHCLNGMTGFHHREPGIIGAALDRQDLFVELICDGHHLHPQTVRLLYLLFGSGRLVLITDRTEAAGLPEGVYRIKGRDLQVTEEGAIIELGRNILRGSSLTMNRALTNFMSMADVSLVEAVKAASLNPARLLGIDGKKGSIAVGKDADVVLLHGDGTVIWTMLQGEICQI